MTDKPEVSEGAVAAAWYWLHRAIQRLAVEPAVDYQRRQQLALDSTIDALQKQRDRLEQRLAETEAKLRAAETLCRIYFEISEEIIGDSEVRKRRDAKIAAGEDSDGGTR